MIKSPKPTFDSSYRANNPGRDPELDANNIEAELDGLEGAFFKLQLKHNERLHKLIARTVKAGLFLERHPEAFADFCERPKWRNVKARPHQEDIERAIHFTLRLAFGSKRASLYGRALKSFDLHNIDLDDLPAMIKQGGGLNKLAAANKASPEEIAAVDDHDILGDSDYVIGDAVKIVEREEDHSVPPVKKGPRQPVPAQPAHHGGRSTGGDYSGGDFEGSILHVEVTDVELRQIVREVREGGNPKITLEVVFERLPDHPSDWTRIRAMEIAYE